MMKIRVKPDLCCAAQLCVLAAPDLIRIDDLGYNVSDGDRVPKGSEDGARRAAESCPEGAIELEDE
jgi:ferredoxin